LQEEIFDISEFLKSDIIKENIINRDETDFDEEKTKTYSKKKKGNYNEEETENEDMNYIVSGIPNPGELEESPQDAYAELMKTRLILEEKLSEFSRKGNFDEKIHEAYSEEMPALYTVSDITVIKYDNPVVMEYSHGQYVFQQIEFRNSSKERTSAYEMTMKAGEDLGIKSEYSKEFDSIYIKEINGIKDGEDGKWWEVYKKKPNGEIKIAEDPIDKIKLNPGETLEWRLASEEHGGCGGVIGESDKYRKDIYKTRKTIYAINNPRSFGNNSLLNN